MREPFRRRDYDEVPEFDWQVWARRLALWANRFIWLIVLAVVGLWLLSGTYTVGPAEVGLVKRFGKLVRTAGPGLHWRLPSPIESVVVVNRATVRTEEIGFRTEALRPFPRYRGVPEEALMLTGDGNITYVEFVVQYVIKEPEQLAFNIINTRELVKQTAQAVVREKVARRTIDQTMTTERDAIAAEAQEELQRLLDTYGSGIQVVNVRLQDVKPPDPVAKAFDDVNSALQDKERTINEATKYANDVLPRARGQAQQILNEAEAYKQTRILTAQGDVARFVSVLERYQLGEDVTQTRLYIETMEQVLPRLRKVVLSQGASGVLSLLDLEKLMADGGEAR